MPSTVEVTCDIVTAMSHAESVLLEIGASIIKRKPYKIKAWVEHPDGFDCKVCIEYLEQSEGDFLDVTRRTGDGLLFSIVVNALRAHFAGNEIEKFYEGQMCPRVVLLPSASPLLEVPALRLDKNGEKRKAVSA